MDTDEPPPRRAPLNEQQPKSLKSHCTHQDRGPPPPQSEVPPPPLPEHQQPDTTQEIPASVTIDAQVPLTSAELMAAIQVAPPSSNIVLDISTVEVAPEGIFHLPNGGQVGSFNHPRPGLARPPVKAPPPTAAAFQATTHSQASSSVPLPSATPPPQYTHHFYSPASAVTLDAPTRMYGPIRPPAHGPTCVPTAQPLNTCSDSFGTSMVCDI